MLSKLNKLRKKVSPLNVAKKKANAIGGAVKSHAKSGLMGGMAKKLAGGGAKRASPAASSRGRGVAAAAAKVRETK